MRFTLFFLFLIWGHTLVADNAYVGYTNASFVLSADFNAAIDLNNVNVELIEAGVFYLSNIYREERNLTSLNYNDKLSEAAYLHSQQMDKYNFFNHVNRKNRSLGSLDKRVAYVGYNHFETIAENIFYGYVNVKEPGTYRELCQFILDNFTASKEHEDNILAKDIKEAGNGIFFQSTTKGDYWYFYFTQDFGSRL